MSRRIEIGALFLLFGLVLFSNESGQAQIGPIEYKINIAFLRGFAVFAFGVSVLSFCSLLLWITKRSWLIRFENYAISCFPTFLLYPAVVIYFSAFFIVFSQSLVMGISQLPWENFRIYLLIFGLIWILAIGINHISQTYRLSKFTRQNRRGNSVKSEWLGHIVDNEMKVRNPPVSFLTWLELKKPGWKSFLIIGGLFGLSIIISWVMSISTPNSFLISEDHLKEYYLTMWQVQGAIAAFALPILIVAIEFSKDLRVVAGKRPEALIRESWIFPIIVFALLGTARFGIDISWFLNEGVFIFDFAFLLVGTICLTIIAYSRMLSILLNTQKMKQHSLSLIKDLMVSQLNSTIRQRIANNILLRNLRELGLEIDTLSFMRKDDNKIILKCRDFGILSDINIGKLGAFIKELPRKDLDAKESSGAAKLNSESTQQYSIRKTQRIFWTKRYGQAITPEDNGLIALEKSQYEISNVVNLEAQLSELIRVKQDRDKGEDVKELIGYVRDGLIDSIRECKTGAVAEGLGIYEELISTFLEKLQQWDAIYKRDTARRESNSLGGGWGEIIWIRGDLHEIIDMTLRIEHIEVLREVFYFPFKMAIKAIHHGDYYIFQQFLDWVPYYYTMTSGMKSVRARDFIISRCSMHLSEMVRYYIGSKIERSKRSEELEEVRDFALGIINIFNKLLKYAYDKKEIEHFKGFLSTLNSAFEFIFKHGLASEVYSLEYQLRNQTLSDSQRETIEQQLSLEKTRKTVVDTLQNTISIMQYGLKAWMSHEYMDNKVTISPADFNKWDKSIPNPKNIEESWEIFSSAKQANDIDFDWSYWESTEHEEGIAYAGIRVFSGGGFNNYLRVLFCVNCLKILGGMSGEQKKSATMPHSDDIVFLAENETSPLRLILKQIEQNKEKWEVVIGETGLEAIPTFEDIMNKAVQVQKEEENNSIKAADLSAERIGVVKQQIINSWKENAEFRKIVSKFGNYEPISDPSEGKTFFGFNQRQPKDMYTESSDIGIEGWGAQFGQDLASSENERFIETTLATLKEFEGEQDTVQIVKAVLDKLEQANYNPIIMILNSWGSYTAIESSESFSKEGNQSNYGLVGHFRKKPVYNLNYQGKPYIIIIDLKRFCIWRQYKPQQLFDGEEYLENELTFLIKAFTEESAREEIKQNSKLLLDKQGNQRPEVEVISELQLSVHFRLLEQYDIEIMDKDSGYKIKAQW